MDSLTVFLVSMGLSLICLIFLLIIAFVVFAVYYFGVIPNRNPAVQVEESINKLASLKREIEALQVRKRGLESQINERHKISQTYEGNKQKLIVDIQKYEQLLAKKEKENRLVEATRQDLQRQIAEKQKILQTIEDNEQKLIINIQHYEQEITKKKDDLHLLETRLLEFSKKSIVNQDTNQQSQESKGQTVSDSLTAVNDGVAENKEGVAISLPEQTIDSVSIPEAQNSFGEDEDQPQNEIEQYPNELELVQTELNEISQQVNKSLQESEQENTISLTCKQCGRTSPVDVIFCRFCGTKFR